MPSLVKRAVRKWLTPLLWKYTSAELQCANIAFSQFGEDIMCHYFFKSGFKGFYVDVGAFHPLLLSNTYGFYRQGWRGLAIDANPDVGGLFARFRPEDVFVHSAVGSQNGSIEMVLFEEGVFNCTADQAHKVPERLRKTERRVTVPIASLASIFAERKVKNIDFLNVDCEGNDLRVLQSNDWSRWRPVVVCVEDHASNWQESEIYNCMESAGYTLKFRAVFSSVFVDDKSSVSLQADSLD